MIINTVDSVFIIGVTNSLIIIRKIKNVSKILSATANIPAETIKKYLISFEDSNDIYNDLPKLSKSKLFLIILIWKNDRM